MEMNYSFGDVKTLYQGAMGRLVGKAYDEQAVFPLVVTVSNAVGESWVVDVAIKGVQFDIKHRLGRGRIGLAFPLRMVAIDSRGDRVASIDSLPLGEAQ